MRGMRTVRGLGRRRRREARFSRRMGDEGQSGG